MLLAAFSDASSPSAQAQEPEARGPRPEAQARPAPPQAGKKVLRAARIKTDKKGIASKADQPGQAKKKARQAKSIPTFDGRARDARGLVDPTIRFAEASPEEIQTRVTKGLDENRIPIHFVRRIVEKARRSGMPEKKLKEVVVEGEDGTLVNAIAFLKEYDLRRQETLRRRQEQRNRKRFTVHEMLDELNHTQPADLARLRKTLPLDKRE